MLVDRNLGLGEYGNDEKTCDELAYLWRHRNQLYRLTRVKAATAAPTTAQYILSKVK